MNEMLDRQPNYTCVEEIERSRRRAPRHRFELVDMLRLEVALVEGKELFSWPGSETFGEQELEKLVPAGGAIGNGQFALFAHAVFRSSAPMFNHRGAAEVEGRRAVRYDYRVPQMQSGFHLKVNGREAVVGYHGSIWADPESFDLIRLEVIADDIPPVLGLQGASNRMDYARARIGASDFLLPAGSELVMSHLAGDEDRNRIRFSACRQYTGESMLTFSESPLSDAVAAAPASSSKPEMVVPGGLSFEAALDREVDSEKSMVGDPITATLVSNLKLRKSILFAKGAKLAGRILRLERHPDHCVLDIRFSAIESDTQRGRVAADLQDIRSLLSNPAFAQSISRQSQPHASENGAITLKGARIHLARGYRVSLRTQPVPARTVSDAPPVAVRE
jgi:hypothetical protein